MAWKKGRQNLTQETRVEWAFDESEICMLKGIRYSTNEYPYPMRIAIYARVSTDDKGQDPENQLRQLRQWCADAGHTITHEYIDHESGRKSARERKQFAALFEDAHKRQFDCVLFWALDCKCGT
jgi:predicted site-specific integrase-resolvase